MRFAPSRFADRSAGLAGLFFVSALTLLCAAFPARAEPVPLTYGGELRLRSEGLNNALDLSDAKDDSYQFERLRYRLWLEAKPNEAVKVYLRLGGEYRWGVYQGNTPAGPPTEAASIRDPESRVSLDNGWAEIRLPRVSGLNLRFGRMDFLLGEGLLVADGTPADGSSSVYFDGLTLNWRPSRGQADLFAFKIQDEGFGTASPEENLFGFDARARGFELYTLHRTKWGATELGKALPTRIVHPRQYTTAIGVRGARLPEAGWQGAAEGAFQTGRYYDKPCVCQESSSDSRRAYGGYARGGRTGGGALRPGLEAGGLFLSGDDPKTGRFEGWDDFYGEWPKYSELLIYTLYDGTTGIRPDDPGAWTNLKAIWAEGRLRPHPRLSTSLRGTWLWAEHSFIGSPGGGLYRGWLLAGQANAKLGAGIEGQALGEYFHPGSYYDRTTATGVSSADPAVYGRLQLVVRF